MKKTGKRVGRMEIPWSLNIEIRSPDCQVKDEEKDGADENEWEG